MDEVIDKLVSYYHSFLEIVPRLAMAILVLVIGILIANWITSVIGKKINSKSHDPLMSGFLSKAINLVLIILICLLTLRIAGLSGIAAAILATAGASAVVLGFAFKDIAENFLAGMILAFNRPFKINDTVKVEDVFGKVKEMEFRYTKIVTFDGRAVYIPNSDVLTKPVYNYTEDGFFRTDFVVGIAYEDDIEQAKETIRNLIRNTEEIVNDGTHTSFVAEDELAASTVNLKVYLWVHTDDFRRAMLEIRGRMIQKVKIELEAKGFNLPADIRELKFYDASSPVRLDNRVKQEKNEQ